MNMKIMKYCFDCGFESPISNFYVTKRGGHSVYCRKHSMIRVQKFRNKEKIEEEFVNHCPPQPNTYFDEHQRQQTFEFLQLLGWTFNEQNNIWYKLPIKNENGIWEFQQQ